MKMVVDGPRNSVTDTLDFGELLHARIFDRFGAAKMPQQLTPALSANTGNIL